MELLSFSDLVFIKLLFAGSVAYSIQQYSYRWRKSPEPPIPKTIETSSSKQTSIVISRSVKQALEQTGKQCIIFYGSQTGTAEKLAANLSKEAQALFGLESMVADLDDFNYDDLASLSSDKIVFLLVATYGEGEPTDNAIAFEKFLESETKKTLLLPPRDRPRSTLHYSAFGLGNSAYQHYNLMVKRVDSALSSVGAVRLGDVGLGDDGQGTLEEDFLRWKTETLAHIATYLGISKKAYKFEPAFEVSEFYCSPGSNTFQGEPNKAHLRGKIRGPFTSKNPYPARIIRSQNMCTGGDRDCLHIEFDIGQSNMTYETGDHVAVWPANSNVEVERFLKVFRLEEKRKVVIDISSRDATLKAPIPSPTTYEAAVRHYLEICGPVSRDFLSVLALFAVTKNLKSKLLMLANDSAAFQDAVRTGQLNLAQLLENLGSLESWSHIPFSLLLENLSKLKPRYYSISSSSLTSKKSVSITAVVESRRIQGFKHEFKGVATNYLQAVSQQRTGGSAIIYPEAENHQVAARLMVGSQEEKSQPDTMVHFRASKFRLPKDSSIPVIMIGPGTGVAPFRAFVQERAKRSRDGKDVGRTLLFYGCRKKNEDFLYETEWKEHAKSFRHGTFDIYTAFSREDSGNKVYVQDLFQQHASELRALLLEQEARVYVCGDAYRMARDVFKAMVRILSEDDRFGEDEQGAEEYLRGLKSSGRWSEDVW